MVRGMSIAVGCLAALAWPALSPGGVGRASATAPRAPAVAVGLAVKPAEKIAGRPGLAVRLTLRNLGKSDAALQHPGNRSAVTYFVTDALGNVVTPVFRGKADPPSRMVALEPGAAYTHTPDDLDFVTGSAWCGYDLKAGESYRVVAIYRPSGPRGPGYSSEEASITPE